MKITGLLMAFIGVIAQILVFTGYTAPVSLSKPATGEYSFNDFSNIEVKSVPEFLGTGKSANPLFELEVTPNNACEVILSMIVYPSGRR
jgi:hypothetical protein